MTKSTTFLSVMVLLVLAGSASAERGPAFAALDGAAAGRPALAFDGNVRPEAATAPAPVQAARGRSLSSEPRVADSYERREMRKEALGGALEGAAIAGIGAAGLRWVGVARV